MSNTKIFLASDLHLEHNAATIPVEEFLERVIAQPMAGPYGNNVLILAGDISPSPQDIQRTIRWANQYYNQVIFLPGNHEYYGHDFKTMAYHKRFVVDTNDIRFICAIGWPNIDRFGNAPIIRKCINDFRAIKNLNILEEAYQDRVFIINETARPTTKKIVVVTHFPPSRICKSDRFPKGPLDDYFYADNDDLLEPTNPVCRPHYWFYGHTHDNVNIGICKSNAYGYFGGETNYSREFIEI